MKRTELKGSLTKALINLESRESPATIGSWSDGILFDLRSECLTDPFLMVKLQHGVLTGYGTSDNPYQDAFDDAGWAFNVDGTDPLAFQIIAEGRDGTLWVQCGYLNGLVIKISPDGDDVSFEIVQDEEGTLGGGDKPHTAG